MDKDKKNAVMDLMYDIQRNTQDYEKVDELVQDYVWGESIRPTILMVDKLNITDTSVLVLTVSEEFLKRKDLRTYLDKLSKGISKHTGIDDILLVMVTDMEDLEELDEDDMELYGWCRV